MEKLPEKLVVLCKEIRVNHRTIAVKETGSECNLQRVYISHAKVTPCRLALRQDHRHFACAFHTVLFVI